MATIAQQAAAQADQQIAEAIRQIEQQRALEQTRINQQRQLAEDLYRRSVGDANHVYDETQSYIGEQNQAIEDLYTNSIADNQASNASLADMLNSIATRSRNDAAAEMQRLGVQGAGMGNFAADDALNQLLSARASADEQANLKLSNTGAVEVGKLLSGMNEGQRASVLGRVLNVRDDRNKVLDNEMSLINQKISDQILNARAKRDALIAELTAKLTPPPTRYYGGGGNKSYSSRSYSNRDSNGNYINSSSSAPAKQPSMLSVLAANGVLNNLIPSPKKPGSFWTGAKNAVKGLRG